jgi:hypothetical protein
VIDVRSSLTALLCYHRFFHDWFHYTKLKGAEILSLADARPCLKDWTSITEIDVHYIYLNAWAFRQIISRLPIFHVDIGSQAAFVTTLSAVVPVIFIDIRWLRINISGLESREGSILSIPFDDKSVDSVSSLHVVEHIGLGRYGDTLDPKGSYKALIELARIVAPNGNLYVGMPVGRPRVCFNAHRIYEPQQIVEWVSDQGLTLKSFACVNDYGKFMSIEKPEAMRDQHYACGMYHFVRKS